jgi:hypothetical protein
MMEAASTSETSVNFYQSTRLYNPEASHLQMRDSHLSSELEAGINSAKGTGTVFLATFLIASERGFTYRLM